MKHFIDCNGIIYPVGTSSDPEWIVINEELSTVYTVDNDGGVTGEYTLWNSLLELAIYLDYVGVHLGQYYGDWTFAGEKGFLGDDVTHWQYDNGQDKPKPPRIEE